MEISVGRQTEAAALAARDKISTLARSDAPVDVKMASIAQSALFEEALLGAVKSRLAELKSVAK